MASIDPYAPPAAVARYDRIAVAFHWLMALLIVAAFAIAISFDDLPASPQKLKLINYHKWVGITVLGLAALRLLWRLTHRPPADVPMPAWQRAGAHAAHWLLYALFFTIPLTGWTYSSARGFPVVWLGVVPLPDLVGKDKALADALRGAHEVMAWSLAAIVAFHVLAALKHHFIDRDNLLARMR